MSTNDKKIQKQATSENAPQKSAVARTRNLSRFARTRKVDFVSQPRFPPVFAFRSIFNFPFSIFRSLHLKLIDLFADFVD